MNKSSARSAVGRPVPLATVVASQSTSANFSEETGGCALADAQHFWGPMLPPQVGQGHMIAPVSALHVQLCDKRVTRRSGKYAPYGLPLFPLYFSRLCNEIFYALFCTIVLYVYSMKCSDRNCQLLILYGIVGTVIAYH